jgi:hypothetical protein
VGGMPRRRLMGSCGCKQCRRAGRRNADNER